MKFEIRFWEKVSKSKSCWLWMGAKENGGYGITYRHPKQLKAHRASWEIHFGKIPKGMCVCHKCDVPSCVNPKHLFLGTIADNNKDKARKNRAARQPGELHGMCKLTQRQVDEMRSIKNPHLPTLSKIYGVSKAQICRILHGQRWKTGGGSEPPGPDQS